VLQNYWGIFMMRLLMIYMLLGAASINLSFHLSFHLQLCSEIPPCILSDSVSWHFSWCRSQAWVCPLAQLCCSTPLCLLRTSIGLLLVSTFEDTRLGRRLTFAWNKTGINLVLVLVYVMMYMHGIITTGPISGWYCLGSYIVSGMFFNTSICIQYCIPRL